MTQATVQNAQQQASQLAEKNQQILTLNQELKKENTGLHELRDVQVITNLKLLELNLRRYINYF